jgi:hypothetical protein
MAGFNIYEQTFLWFSAGPSTFRAAGDLSTMAQPYSSSLTVRFSIRSDRNIREIHYDLVLQDSWLYKIINLSKLWKRRKCLKSNFMLTF